MYEKEFKDITANKDYFLDLCGKLEASNEAFPALRIVSNIMDTLDGAASRHAERIRTYMEIFISAVLKYERYKNEVSAWDVELFLMSVQVYDVGKIVVSDQILKKEEKLTAEEFEGVKIHADFGVRIIQQIKRTVDNDKLLRHAEALAGSHHEKWDGTGYPHGLAGKEIPLEGRLMAIVDVYDALTSERPHRSRRSHQEAVNIIKSNSGTHFDPELVGIFLECEKELESAAAHEGCK